MRWGCLGAAAVAMGLARRGGAPDAFARLIEGGAIRESGKSYVAREVRANEMEE